MSGATLLALCARLLPRGLRERRGGDILADARRLLERERTRRGRSAELALALRIATDLARVALAERGPRRAVLPSPRTPLPRRTPMTDRVAQELLDAWRGLRRAPGYAAAVIVTLALGVGANAGIFAVVHAALLRPLPFADPDRLVLLWEKNPERGWDVVQAAPANVLDWGERARSLAGVAGFSDWFDRQTVSAPGEPTPVKTMRVMGDLFGVLGAPPLLGRAPTAAETWAGGESVALLSHRLWRERFGGDPSIVGRRIEIDREPVTVIGVMPAEFALWSEETDLWRPFGWSQDQKAKTSFRRAHYVRGVGRLAAGVSADVARAELESIAAALEREYPATNRLMGAGMTPLRTWLVGDLRRPLLLLFAAVTLVLLVACANVTHLALARAVAREHDLALRGCLGASPARLARRGLLESLLLSGIGALAGCALAAASVPALARLGGDDLARLGEVAVGPAVIAFGAAMAAVAALVSGALPALQARSTRLERALREAGRAGEGRRRGVARQLLVGVEVAFAVVLVAGALLLVRSLAALGQVPAGFEPSGVLSASIALPPQAYPDSAAIVAFEERLVERLESLPGVERVGLTNRLPLTGESWSSDFSVEGRSAELFGIDVLHREASPGYFDALGVPIVAGRGFAASDDLEAPAVVLINQALARRYFAGVDPIGLRVCFDRVPEAGSVWRTIVGVVGDERQGALGKAVRPEFLAPVAQDPNGGPRLVVKSSLPAESLVPALRGALAELDPRLPLFEIRAMDDVVADSLARERFLLRLFGAFALLALVLAAVGVYGVAAHGAAGRRREIGVRIALGALPRQALARLVSRGALAVCGGAAVGVAGAWALGRGMSGLLYGVSAGDPVALSMAPLVLALSAGVATWLPARRAVRVPPAEVLRAE